MKYNKAVYCHPAYLTCMQSTSCKMPSWMKHKLESIMANRWGNNGNSDRLYFGGAPKSLQIVTAAMKLKDTPCKKSYDQPRQHIKKQRHYFAKKSPSSEGYGFSCGHVWM